jgi:enediyne biosynthesis protein E7
MSPEKTAKMENIPQGPQESYKPSDDLLHWMQVQFEKFGDIYKATIYGTGVYAIRDVESAHHVLVENWQNYVKGLTNGRVALLLGNGLMVSEGELWKRQRRMIQPTFSHESIKALVELMLAVNSRLLRKWQGAAKNNEPVNVTRDVSAMALEIVLRFIFGKDYESIAPHFDLLSQEQTRDIAFARSFRALTKVALNVVEQRRKFPEPTTDALRTLMLAREPQSGQRMQDHQLIDEILTLIVAGHETTASTLNWVWYLVSQHPAVEEKLSNEVDQTTFSEFNDLQHFCYTRQVIDETMRLYPAGWLLTRKSLSDDRLGKYFVPAGTEIYVSPYFIQRHPDVWKEPNRFDPDRFQPDSSKCRHRLATIPFSAGPRNCIGANFARVEMQVHVLTIAKHLRLRHIPSGPVEVEAGVNLRSRRDFIMFPESKEV